MTIAEAPVIYSLEQHEEGEMPETQVRHLGKVAVEEDYLPLGPGVLLK